MLPHQQELQTSDQAGKVEDPVIVTIQPSDDIPVALRETPDSPAPKKLRPMAVVGIATALGLVAMVTGGLFAVQMGRSQQPESSPVAASPASGTASNSPSPDAAAQANQLLGHFQYAEAPQSDLASIVGDGSIKLRKSAAQAYQRMEAAARQDGVILVPISGFRTLADQNYLFFDKKAERGQVAAERAKVSAPPGHSEHHTGYAIDIGDGNTPATNLSPSFENTAAFRWLQANAAFYSFEISFPKNNKQGVSYEPWHWRYVGDSDSLETFYRARQAAQ